MAFGLQWLLVATLICSWLAQCLCLARWSEHPLPFSALPPALRYRSVLPAHHASKPTCLQAYKHTLLIPSPLSKPSPLLAAPPSPSSSSSSAFIPQLQGLSTAHRLHREILRRPQRAVSAPSFLQYHRVSPGRNPAPPLPQCPRISTSPLKGCWTSPSTPKTPVSPTRTCLSSVRAGRCLSRWATRRPLTILARTRLWATARIASFPSPDITTLLRSSLTGQCSSNRSSSSRSRNRNNNSNSNSFLVISRTATF